jgi:hypothetical protein
MLKVAEKEPAAAGLNATYTVQLAPPASVAPQVFSASKSVGLVPASAIDVSVRVAVPELVSVTGIAAEVVPCVVVGKARLVTLSLTEGAAVPVPVRATFCGDPLAVSVTLSVAVSALAVAGLKAT